MKFTRAKNISCENLAQEIIKWKPDRVISLSVPDDNSFRDACVKDILEKRYGVPTIMHPLDATLTMANKWLTKQLVKSVGFLTPEGVFVDSDQLHGRGIQYIAYRDYLLRKTQALGYPVIVKSIWDSLSLDMEVINDECGMNEYLTNRSMNKNFIIEKYIDGSLCMLEFHAHGGKIYFQPLITQCVTSISSFIPFHHFRCATVAKSLYNEGNLKQALAAIAKKINLSGVVNVDLIYKDGQFYVLEINPRVSGITSLSISSSGVNTYQILLEMAMGTWAPEKITRKSDSFAIEVPVHPVNEAVMNVIRAIPEVMYINKFISWNSSNSIEHSMMHLCCKSAAKCGEILAGLQGKYLLFEESKFRELSKTLAAYN